MAGKGDRVRPFDKKKFDEGYDRAFREAPSLQEASEDLSDVPAPRNQRRFTYQGHAAMYTGGEFYDSSSSVVKFEIIFIEGGRTGDLLWISRPPMSAVGVRGRVVSVFNCTDLPTTEMRIEIKALQAPRSYRRIYLPAIPSPTLCPAEVKITQWAKNNGTVRDGENSYCLFFIN